MNLQCFCVFAAFLFILYAEVVWVWKSEFVCQDSLQNFSSIAQTCVANFSNDYLHLPTDFPTIILVFLSNRCSWISGFPTWIWTPQPFLTKRYTLTRLTSQTSTPNNRKRSPTSQLKPLFYYSWHLNKLRNKTASKKTNTHSVFP